jgi:hypothetical protein
LPTNTTVNRTVGKKFRSTAPPSDLWAGREFGCSRLSVGRRYRHALPGIAAYGFVFHLIDCQDFCWKTRK